MKSFFVSIAGSLGALLLSSCSDYGYYGSSQSYGYSPGYSSVNLGIVSTNYSRWGYDPYRRSYYDYSLGRYYNHHARRYCTVVPHRYSRPVYPHGYRHGRKITVPTYLPHRSSSSGHRYHNHGRVSSYRTTPSIHRGYGQSSDRFLRRSDSYRQPDRGVSGRTRFNRGSNVPTLRTPSTPPRRVAPPRQTIRPPVSTPRTQASRRLEVVNNRPTGRSVRSMPSSRVTGRTSRSVSPSSSQGTSGRSMRRGQR